MVPLKILSQKILIDYYAEPCEEWCHMTPEQQRIAIAEACGWKVVQGDDELLVHREGEAFCHQLPDYLNDLNAMHEAEQMLNEEQQDLFAENFFILILGQECFDVMYGSPSQPSLLQFFELFQATALQRAEAFLKTLNLWKD